MDIYKITDEIPDEAHGKARGKAKDGARDEAKDGTREWKITNLKQGVKNPNRVNVFIDGKFEFSLDMAQVVELGVKVGLVISPEKLVKFKRASEYGKLYQRALEWVLTRPRSEREVRDYLKRKETKLVDSIVQQLISKGYVDDRRFAEFWVENRFVKKGVSRRRLMMELRQKGISQEIIDEVIDGRDESEEIRKMIMRKKNKYTEEKLMQYLCRQGFKYDKVKEVLDDYLSSSTSEGA